MSCLRGTPCCSNEVTSLYIPARRSADGWLRSKFFKTSSREKVCFFKDEERSLLLANVPFTFTLILFYDLLVKDLLRTSYFDQLLLLKVCNMYKCIAA